jgi:hypothetical protein
MIDRPFAHDSHCYACAQNLHHLELFCTRSGIEILFVALPVPVFLVTYESGQRQMFINKDYEQPKMLLLAYKALGIPLFTSDIHESLN